MPAHLPAATRVAGETRVGVLAVGVPGRHQIDTGPVPDKVRRSGRAPSSRAWGLLLFHPHFKTWRDRCHPGVKAVHPLAHVCYDHTFYNCKTRLQ